ncbi:hypothetical protein ABZ554_14910 [Streptomyces sp. NPDC020125]
MDLVDLQVGDSEANRVISFVFPSTSVPARTTPVAWSQAAIT